MPLSTRFTNSSAPDSQIDCPIRLKGTDSMALPSTKAPRNDDGTIAVRKPSRTEARAPSTAGPGSYHGDEFNDLAHMASHLLDTQTALVFMAEGEGFRVVAEHGCVKAQGFCERAICRSVNEGTQLLMVLDASADARFRDDRMVAVDGVRFFLGIALLGPTGQQLGVLAVADLQPRASVPEEALAMLRRLARVASRLLERRSLERSSRILEQIAQDGFSALVMLDPRGMVVSMNIAAQAMFGSAIVGGESLRALFPPALQHDPGATDDWLCDDTNGVHGTTTQPCRLRVHSCSGEIRTLEAVRCRLPEESNASALILRDITDSLRLFERQHSALTDLPNRDALLVVLAALRSQGKPIAVALLGLDNFSAVNDILGHAIGDALLQVVACRLLAQLPTDAHLAHIGGDEFALAFPVTTTDAIDAGMHTLLRDLARPCEIDHHRVHLEASIGVAMDEFACALIHDHAVPDSGDIPGALDQTDVGELLTHARLAMQHAKRAGGQQLRHFTPGMRTEAIDRRTLEIELRRACHEAEFELHYQPQIDLISGRPTGAEALLRWRHPERGLLFPGEFIDALSHSVVAPAVGRWILQRACRDAAAWPVVNGRRLGVGVNLFPVQFEDVHLVDEVHRALALSGLPPEQLEIELTETIALRNDGVAEQVLMQLRARGVRVSFDDFGTGYASLSMLQRLPVDRLKIDRSFVSNVVQSRGDEAIVRSIILIARNFDLEVIAEGVETQCQASLLREIGCHGVQGFLYSKALPPADLDRWLVQHLDPRLTDKDLSHG